MLVHQMSIDGMPKAPKDFKTWWKFLKEAPKLVGPWKQKKAMNGDTIWYRESPYAHTGDIVSIYGPYTDDNNPGEQVWTFRFAVGIIAAVPGTFGLDNAKADADRALEKVGWILLDYKDLGWTTPDETQNWSDH